MHFEPPLEPARLIKRYKRFLADVTHPELGEITVHCPNTGSMKNCWSEGWRVWLQNSHNPKRKYLYTWVLAENEQGHLIGVNTQFANQLVYDAILADKIKQLSSIESVLKEVKYGEESSRIDVLVNHTDQTKTYIEVKSVTLKDPDVFNQDQSQKAKDTNELGCFPDSVTTRGQKHLRELIHCVEAGHRAILFFMVQHTGIKEVTVARHIDSKYAELLQQAIEKGVEVVAYGAKISCSEIVLDQQLKFTLSVNN
ncbi:MAG: DNA/RNA nuclease SfsA [Kangiellaceae bacterium]|nr:DNA/RNA nuclease SfsA [Kangiellaceae bacterium]